MNYTKPQVAVLGQAVRVIEAIPPVKGRLPVYDGVPPLFYQSPAYDLDE